MCVCVTVCVHVCVCVSTGQPTSLGLFEAGPPCTLSRVHGGARKSQICQNNKGKSSSIKLVSMTTHRCIEHNTVIADLPDFMSLLTGYGKTCV